MMHLTSLRTEPDSSISESFLLLPHPTVLHKQTNKQTETDEEVKELDFLLSSRSVSDLKQ